MLTSDLLFVILPPRTDKWAETELGTKWGDKWEEKFFSGIGSRQGETWHVSPSGERKSMLASYSVHLNQLAPLNFW